MKNDRPFRQILLGAGCAMALAALVPAALAAGKSEKPKPYPLKTCVVSGEKLGGMGDPYVFTYQGREIKLCCKGCLKDFNKEPANFIKKLEEAEKTAKEGLFLAGCQSNGSGANSGSDHSGHEERHH